MNWENYRHAIDSISFSPDFQERTIALLRRTVCGEQKKEKYAMKHKKVWRAAMAVACAAVLTVSAYAAVQWLTPAQVADYVKEPGIAEAFSNEDAVLMDETRDVGEYKVHLLGTVSGQGLSVLNPDAEQSHTYVVLAVERQDGSSVTLDEMTGYQLLPMVAGQDESTAEELFSQRSVTYFELDGKVYWLWDMETLEKYADRTAYLAFYQGIAPSMFTMAEDGSFSIREDSTEPCALFTLP